MVYLSFLHYRINFTDILNEEMGEIENSQPMSMWSVSSENEIRNARDRPAKHTGQYGDFRSTEEIGIDILKSIRVLIKQLCFHRIHF